MNTIDLNLGDDVIVKGCLYDSMEPRFLREDILEIDLPSGDTISVGWDSESGPSGRFIVVVFRDYWEDRKGATFASTIPELVRRIRWIAEQYGTRELPAEEPDDGLDDGMIISFKVAGRQLSAEAV